MRAVIAAAGEGVRAAAAVGAVFFALATGSGWAATVTNTFVFSGALKGTLHVVPAKDCSGAGPQGVTLDTITGTLAGSKANDWTIMILSLKNGTFKLHQGSIVGVSLSGSRNEAVQAQWGTSPSGTLSVHGTSGSLNAELSSTSAGVIHIAGSWKARRADQHGPRPLMRTPGGRRGARDRVPTRSRAAA